jgi:hypothetical protein
MANKEQLPIYQKLILALKSGYKALDNDTQQQVADFIITQQNVNGAFNNRGGNPDFYYSLFGYWLCEELELNDIKEKHRVFIDSYAGKEPAGTIDLLAYTLIRIGLSHGDKAGSAWTVLKKILRERGNIDFSYRFFLLMIVLDAQRKFRKTLLFFATPWLYFYKPAVNTPCSILSALIFIKNQAGLNHKKEQDKLLALYENGSGFRVFRRVTHSDMLSTAVALFVLRAIGYDLRLISPGCLNFVEGNYHSGAFMSGDGDQSLDLEYTFYGLVALGSLMQEKND